MLTPLAPLAVLLSWSMFMISKSLIVSLVTLLLSSLTLPLVFMDTLKLFWPCGLLLILTSTGLIVVFAYIVSLHSESKTASKWKSISQISIGAALMLSFSFSLNSIHNLNLKINVNLMLSVILILVLLFLVINFVRLVYSKGGGFRKKF